MTGTTALNAYNDSVRHTVPEIVDDLRVALGAKLVAYIACVSESRTVREWAEAVRRPTDAAEERLRLAHRIVTLISQSEGEAIVPTWFQGMNPQLDDRSPARVLHEDSFDQAGVRVLAAANAFVDSTDRQPSAVEGIISRFEQDQIRAPTIAPTPLAQTSLTVSTSKSRGGRPWKGARDLLGTRPPSPLAEAARHRAAELDMTVSDYLVTLIAKDVDPLDAANPNRSERVHEPQDRRIRAVTLTEASKSLSALIDEAHQAPVFLSRRGRPVAAIVEAEQLEQLRADSEELADIRAGNAAGEDAGPA